jgi:hypothetical protein
MPFLATRGSGSSKALGRAAKVGIASLSDTFARSTSNTLGVPSGRGISWRNQRGTWSTNGSVATSANDKSTNAITTILTASSTISNLQVDTQSSGGTGLAFWVVDADNWWAATTGFATGTTTSTTSTTTCSGGGTGWQLTSYPGGCCGGFRTTTGTRICRSCCNGVSSCSTSPGENPPSCPSLGTSTCGNSSSERTWYGCDVTNVTTTTTINISNYLSNFKLINNGNVVVNTQYNANTSSIQTSGSIAISTSGNVISYFVYSSANKGGTLLHSGSYTASNPTKGRNVGVFKGDGGTSQGSNLGNFSVTVAA